jgi:hypothetical protein
MPGSRDFAKMTWPIMRTTIGPTIHASTGPSCTRRAQGKVKATVSRAKIEDINDIFVRMHKGQIEGRIVLDLAA